MFGGDNRELKVAREAFNKGQPASHRRSDHIVRRGLKRRGAQLIHVRRNGAEGGEAAIYGSRRVLSQSPTQRPRPLPLRRCPARGAAVLQASRSPLKPVASCKRQPPA